MTGSTRVTITLPSDIRLEIDRAEKNRSRFVLEAVQREIVKRRKQALELSLAHPHPESQSWESAGLAEWFQAGDGDAAELLDLNEGIEVAWIPDKRGTVALVALEPTLGHEQRGIRPCVVVSDPDVTSSQVAAPWEKGLSIPNWRLVLADCAVGRFALVDQLRSLNKQRVRKLYGSISPAELLSVEEGLRLYLSI